MSLRQERDWIIAAACEKTLRSTLLSGLPAGFAGCLSTWRAWSPRCDPPAFASFALDDSGLFQIFITTAHDVSGNTQRVRQGPFTWEQTSHGQRACFDQTSKLIRNLPCH